MPARVKRLSRTESVAQTRTRLLDAAEEVFAEHGFGATTLERIAERAGYTRGAVYANFASKDDLFLAVLDRWLDDDIEHGGRINAESPSVRDAFDRLRELPGNRFADRNRFLLLTEFRLYALRNPEVAPRLAEYERRGIAWYTDAIRARAADLPVPAEQLAAIVLAMENGIATLAHVAPDTVRHDAFVDALEMLTGLR
ncbi:TetR/AcrR family transcriptional regulator [Actinophytocola algeriensis]|uniref:AcrR family transcriptional regulator n=1 Tax=Actinophytocola algeriensis TaxID=1768010 RepID=A0A7W7QC79_9PSEU|nr:TetR/AcrR family transcriptional regulator [Actinophytocola algeriensis]MBB4910885.1 AcrR family transcriptional regulator [Actinophytocola algeriensis]MBE1473878.1 AcrR family transcriptional regulator [Actinophytocola algeriensis]